MQKVVFFFFGALLLAACQPTKEQADLLLFNCRIYTVDEQFNSAEAMVIREGRILALGTEADLRSRYKSAKEEDLKGSFVYPGFIDAHAHFLGYGLGLGRVDLRGTNSFREVAEKVVISSKKENLDNAPAALAQPTKNDWIIGRGWDQNDWQKKEMPDRGLLDSLFPDRPVMLTRIDGHAALVNGKALQLAGITAKTKISGGEIVMKDNQPSGVLIDNAVDLVSQIIPPVSDQIKQKALQAAEENCFAVGLTSVVDAGLMKDEVQLIDQLQKSNKLKIRLYVMLRDSAPNYSYLKTGPYKTEKLSVCSFKFYVDGALGSRGACLYAPYTDKKTTSGFLLNTISHFEKSAALIAAAGFQMNSHCIGDSAFGLMTRIYSTYCKDDGKRRWRIEHAQITQQKDLQKLNRDIVPSVQPTHATSDMYWAHERLGKDRMRASYAYLQLLKQSGIIALGTDFPVEDISPIKTFYAAVVRKDQKGFPSEGFQKENALSREQTLRGMTIWAAYANFESKEKGSLEKGKFADFVILDQDLMKCAETQLLKTRVLSTYLSGEKVYSVASENH